LVPVICIVATRRGKGESCSQIIRCLKFFVNVIHDTAYHRSAIWQINAHGFISFCLDFQCPSRYAVINFQAGIIF
jgi:hypothetical protein